VEGYDPSDRRGMSEGKAVNGEKILVSRPRGSQEGLSAHTLFSDPAGCLKGNGYSPIRGESRRRHEDVYVH